MTFPSRTFIEVYAGGRAHYVDANLAARYAQLPTVKGSTDPDSLQRLAGKIVTTWRLVSGSDNSQLQQAVEAAESRVTAQQLGASVPQPQQSQ